jgi:hypothetical protein
MLLYADHNFAFPVVEALRLLGHDVLTASEDGHAAAADTASNCYSSATKLGSATKKGFRLDAASPY